MSKVRTAAQAVAGIADRANVAIAGFRWAGAPEMLMRALGQRFRDTGTPKGLTVLYSSAQGDSADTGLEHLAQRGLLGRVIGGFWGLSPKLSALAEDNSIEAYNFPQGQICRLYTAIAAGLPGLVSNIGLHSYIDPRNGGGRLNTVTTTPLVEVVQLRGREWLLYHALPIHVGFIRGTTADEGGNISLERESVTTEVLALAFAAHNSGGRVIAQVQRVVPTGAIHPRQVAVPGHVVDDLVVAEHLETDHRQCVQSVYDPVFTGDEKAAERLPAVTPLLRRIIAMRAACELRDGDVVNLGQGIPTDIAELLRQQAAPPSVTFTIESGVVGGRPEAPPDFGIAASPDAILRQDDQFTFYNGGGLDIAFLGFAEVDRLGNVNVSRFGNRLVGCGGFLDIAQPTKRLVFCGTLTAGGLKVALDGGHLRIEQEGRLRKFVPAVKEVTFSAASSIRGGQPIIYVTERCVFSLTSDGLRLDEVAPGIDVRRDVVDQVEFPLHLAANLKPMLLPQD